MKLLTKYIYVLLFFSFFSCKEEEIVEYRAIEHLPPQTLLDQWVNTNPHYPKRYSEGGLVKLDTTFILMSLAKEIEFTDSTNLSLIYSPDSVINMNWEVRTITVYGLTDESTETFMTIKSDFDTTSFGFGMSDRVNRELNVIERYLGLVGRSARSGIVEYKRKGE